MTWFSSPSSEDNTTASRTSSTAAKKGTVTSAKPNPATVWAVEATSTTATTKITTRGLHRGMVDDSPAQQKDGGALHPARSGWARDWRPCPGG